MQRMLGLENDHPGFGERALSAHLRTACCNAPVLQWRWEAADMYMLHCAECREPIAAPTGEDMERLERDKAPRLNDVLENLTVVDLEKGSQVFRTITIA